MIAERNALGKDKEKQEMEQEGFGRNTRPTWRFCCHRFTAEDARENAPCLQRVEIG